MNFLGRVSVGLVGVLLLLIQLAGTIYLGQRVDIAWLGFGGSLVGFVIVAVADELAPLRWYKTLGGSLAGAIGTLTLYSEVVTPGPSWAEALGAGVGAGLYYWIAISLLRYALFGRRVETAIPE